MTRSSNSGSRPSDTRKRRGDAPSESRPLSEETLRRCMQNRELSWLRFNERVAEEAAEPSTPLFERFFFLSIFTTNLDEFFMVRVGSLSDHVHNNTGAVDNKTGLNAEAQLERIYEAAVRLYANRDAVCRDLEAALAREGVPRLSPDTVCGKAGDRRLLERYFDTQVHPLLSPQIVDTSHPFPHIENKRLIVAVWLESKGRATFGMIPLPNGMERLYFTESGGYVLLEDVIAHFCEKVFKRYTVVEKAVISVTRNADLAVAGERFDEDEDFREHMSKLLKTRKRLAPVRLEVQGEFGEKPVAFLQKKLSLTTAQTFFSHAPLDLSYCALLRDKVSPARRRELSFAPFEPAVAPYARHPGDTIHRIRSGDLLLAHPFESLQAFLSLVRDAATDRQVLSIRITLYRIAEHSKLVEYLISAAENGKDVSVFIELRARMDEESNIGWAKRMEDAGCRVFYGPADYKMHAKICLITRRDGFRNEFVTHIGTGNYNERTARLYTDISLITTHDEIGKDAARFFHNMMIGAFDDAGAYGLLWVAPRFFKVNLIGRIRAEAARGAQGHITIKCNSLTDRDVICALIDASRAGATVELIIRGICCLIPGIEDLTDRIHIRSIVGRFLEHSRIYRFGSGEESEIFIGSGDMMTRNTERRIELFTPIPDAKLRRRLSDMLDTLLRDNVKARELRADGTYARVAGDAPVVDSQFRFIPEARENAESASGSPSGAATFPRGFVGGLLKGLRKS